MISHISKHTLTLLAILLGSFASLADVGELNSVDENGNRQGYWVIKGYMVDNNLFPPDNIVEEGQYSDNKKEGVWKKYYPGGEIRSEITYVSNKPYGEYKILYKNGVVEEQGVWHRNKNVGEFTRNYQNGNPQQKFHFADNGKRNGVQYYYHENGNLELEVSIVNGKEEGVMKRFHEDGSIKEEITLVNGVMQPGSKRTYDTKEVTKEEIYETIATETKVEKSDKVNTAAETTNAAAGFKPNGHNVLYDKNQQMTQVGDFKDGRLWDGKWHKYNTDGILIRIEIYRNGKYVGTGVIEEE